MESKELAQLEAQRLAFEAQFGSLESMGFEDKTKQRSMSVSSSSSSAETNDEPCSDFEGFSDHDDPQQHNTPIQPLKHETRSPRIIKFNAPSDHKPSKISRKQQKLLHTGKATTLIQHPSSNSLTESTDESDNDAENLKNDIELQQFLQESNLLSALNFSPSEQIHGKVRARTLEMRLQSLSSTNSIANPKLEKMPMTVRKGMITKHEKRIATFESEARDAGTVLSKVKKGHFRKIPATYTRDLERRIGSKNIPSKSVNIRRERGLKINSVGKSTRNGLRLSKAEIARISSSK